MQPEKPKAHINVDYFEDLTGDIARETTGEDASIGHRVHSLRRQKGLSLDDLSAMTGFDVDFLAGIEKNEIQPQLGTMMKLSKALDAAFGRLVSGSGDRLYAIGRKDQRQEIHRSTTRKGARRAYSYHSLAAPVKGRHMETLFVRLDENPEPHDSVHEGEEFIYVLKGTVTLKIGKDRYELAPGDSAYYLSTTPHLLAAKEGTADILAVLYEG